MAALLENQLDLEVELVVGKPGELTVWLGDQLVAEKTGWRFPDPDDVVAAVRDALRA